MSILSIDRDFTYAYEERYYHPPKDPQLQCDDPVLILVRVQHIPRDEPEFIRTSSAIVLDRGLLLSEETAGPALSPILSSVGLLAHEQTELISELSCFSRGLTSVEKCDCGCNRLIVPGIVSFARIVEVDPFNLAMGEFVPVGVFRTVPATESSIESLERLVHDGGGVGSMEQCTICFEELVGGSQVSRMTCLHVYHDDCIVKWLMTSHFCPLCRYEMPS